MKNTRVAADDIYWVGGTDRRVKMFENLFPLNDGMSYNSFVILDEKTALMDTVDTSISDIYLQNVESALNGRKLDYLVIHHMEPDHCANIEAIVARHPDVQLVGNKTTFKLLEQFYFMRDEENYYTVKENDILDLGKHKLRFLMAPSVHWPEVMVTFEETEGILFSADSFGTFAPLDGNLYTDCLDFEGRITSEARRYYTNIVGRFGANVVRLLDKVAKYPVKKIFPLHGPLYRSAEHVQYMLEHYRLWATYTPEQSSVLIVFGSMYGNTENALDILAAKLADKGVKNIRMYDVSGMDASYIISDMFSYSHIVFASPNYNSDIFYKVDHIIDEALRLNLKNRKISLLANYSWGGNALKTMQEYFSDDTKFEIVGEPVQIKSSVKDENDAALEALADSITASVKAESQS